MEVEPSILLVTTCLDADTVVWASLPTSPAALQQLGQTKVFTDHPGVHLPEGQESSLLDCALLSFPEALIRGDGILEPTLQGLQDLESPLDRNLTLATRYSLEWSANAPGWVLPRKASGSYVQVVADFDLRQAVFRGHNSIFALGSGHTTERGNAAGLLISLLP
jgi:hypothetical protein